MTTWTTDEEANTLERVAAGLRSGALPPPVAEAEEPRDMSPELYDYLRRAAMCDERGSVYLYTAAGDSPPYTAHVTVLRFMSVFAIPADGVHIVVPT